MSRLALIVLAWFQLCACVDVDALYGSCLDAGRCTTLGESCDSSSACSNLSGTTSRECLTKLDGVPLPGGYCSGACSPRGATCANGVGICVLRSGNEGNCLVNCESTSDCRAGYVCQRFGTTETVCTPACSKTNPNLTCPQFDGGVAFDCVDDDGSKCCVHATSPAYASCP